MISEDEGFFFEGFGKSARVCWKRLETVWFASILWEKEELDLEAGWLLEGVSRKSRSALEEADSALWWAVVWKLVC